MDFTKTDTLRDRPSAARPPDDTGTVLYTPPLKRRIAARFGRAADGYEAAAVAQADILSLTAEMMRPGIGSDELWCDVGSGGGMLIDRLSPLPRGTRVVCLDIAVQTLRRAARTGRTELAVGADIEFSPVKRGAFDGIAAISMLQWTEAPEEALRNIADMLKPSGQFYFSVFVEGAFTEIIELRKRMKLGAAVKLPTASEFFLMLDNAGFEVSESDIRFFDRVARFPDAMSALGSLSDTGATASGGRLLSRAELDRLYTDYTTLFSEDGKVTLTYRATLGKARKK